MEFKRITSRTQPGIFDRFEHTMAKTFYVNRVYADLNAKFRDLTLDDSSFMYRNGGAYVWGGVNILGTVGMGINNDANPYLSTIIGYGATIEGGTGGLYNSSVNGATLLGNGAYHRAANGNGIAIGRGAVTDSFGVAIGSASCAITGARSVAIGSRNSFVIGDYSITIGGNTTVTGSNSVIVGYGSYVTGNNSAAFGPGVTVMGDNLIKIGNSTHTIRLDGLLAVGTTAANDASALVQFDSTTKGVLGPRMTTTQINAIVSPAKGLEVFNTTLNKKCFYDGTSWQQVTTSAM
jgi:hypothetical protein